MTAVLPIVLTSSPTLVTPLVTPEVVAPAAAPSPKDVLEAARASSRSTSQRAPREENPFKDLRADAPRQQPRLVERERTPERAPEPSMTQLQRLSDFEGQLFRASSQLLDGTRVGLLLVHHEGQEQRTRVTPWLDEKTLRAFAARMQRGQQITEEEATAFWRQLTRYASRAQLDVQAMVSRVLREAYVLSSEVMMDLAERLRRTNELRKAIREELRVSKETQTAWIGLPEGERPQKPWRRMKVDVEHGTLVPDTWGAAELAAAIEQHRGVGQGVSALAEAVDQFQGESQLSEQERSELEVATGGNDDHVRDRLHVIIRLLPKLRADDLKHYVGAALHALEGGNTDEAEIRELFTAMSPEQAVFMVSHGYDSRFFGFGGSDHGDFALIVNGKARELGAQIGLEDADILSSVEPASPLFEVVHCLTKAEANRLLERVRQASREVGTATKQELPAEMRLGAPRLCTTPEELEDYIEALEEDLNTQGEDAQLQNVTLQEQLQRQQHTLQLLSSIARMLHDTAMAVVRKIND